MYVCMHVCMNVCLYVRMYVRMYMRTYVCICMYICMYAFMTVGASMQIQANLRELRSLHSSKKRSSTGLCVPRCLRNLSKRDRDLNNRIGHMIVSHMAKRRGNRDV